MHAHFLPAHKAAKHKTFEKPTWITILNKAYIFQGKNLAHLFFINHFSLMSTKFLFGFYMHTISACLVFCLANSPVENQIHFLKLDEPCLLIPWTKSIRSRGGRLLNPVTASAHV